MTSIPITPPYPAAASPRRRGWFAQLGVDTAYVVVGFPLAVISFAVGVSLICAGAGLLAAFLVGIPVFVLALLVARGLAEVERSRIVPVLRRPRVPVVYRRSAPGSGWLRRLFSPLAEGQYWLDTVYGLLRFPVTFGTFSVVVTWWASALGGLSYGLWDWSLPRDANPEPGVIVVNNRGLPDVLGIANTTTNRILIYTAIGIVFTVTLPFVVRACALIDAWLAHGLLNGVAGLRHQVADLARSRDVATARTAAAVSAEANALRRLERDLHDGPQQRLVRLAMDLGRARVQLGSDPDAAARTVDEAITQTREALDELRTLSRGIAPPILTDRGLAAASAALAARSTVAVRVELAQLPRLPALTEQTAYFTIAEALTNVAKHSGATSASVSASLDGDRLIVDIADDGRGGAHLAKGHGLAGLADRLQGVGGQLWVSSPPGGPTSIRAEVPAVPAASVQEGEAG
ncbi:MAG TPA: sensor domain-containing protein [Micromonosporaceae bacterium]|jgi:signal transduction histidine kinase